MNSKDIYFKNSDGSIKFSIDLSVYPLEAVYGTAYVFIDKAYLFLSSKSSKKIEVFLKGKKKLSQKQQSNLVGEFLNELLNYTLRVKVAKNNKRIREYIIEQALVSAVGGAESLKEGNESERSKGYEDDPLGIAVPWEEKYGENK